MAEDTLNSRIKMANEWLNGRAGGYLIILSICLVAIWPFLTHAGLPRATDAELHIFRLAELGRLVRGGVLYPRWAPNFYFGYGYPIFNYYAPLAYYAGLPLELLPAVDAVQAVKAVFVFSLLAGALGMFGFVRTLWGRSAAFVAAAAYVYAPYIQYVDPHARGDLAEALSFGLFPLALWFLSRLQEKQTPWTWLAAVGSSTAVILSHNLMALIFFAMLTAWAIWLAFLPGPERGEREAVERQQPPTPAATARPLRHVTVLLGALILAAGLTAFFWLPVALEQDVVNLNNLIGEGGHFDFRNHFLTLAELLGPSRWLDWGATQPAFSLNLGVAQWLLALLGVVALVTKQARRRRAGAFFALAAVALIFMMTEASTILWERVPLLPYLQFPWRLLGPAAALLAVLAGIGSEAAMRLLRRTARRGRDTSRRRSLLPGPAVLAAWLPVLLIGYLMALALPMAMVPPWPAGGWDTSALGVLTIERQGRWLGTTSTGDFVPATVEVVPGLNEQMLQSFQAGEPLDRVNRATLPQGVRVESQSLTPLHTRYQVSADQQFLLRLFLFSFPGWQARIDGRVVDTDLARPEGLLVVPVPAGEHVVDVEFVDTGARLLAWIVSAAALLLVAAAAVGLPGKGAGPDRASPPRPGRAGSFASSTSSVAILLLAVLMAVILPVAQSLELFHLQSTGDVAIPAEHDVTADFGGQVALLGYDAPDRASPGETVEVVLYWRAQREMDINFQVFVHLLGDALVAQSDKLNPGEFPTRRWPLNKYVRDRHSLMIPRGLAPGTYRLSTGMWVQEEGWRLPLFDEDGRQIGDHFVLTEITVR